jgi:hypothetical protein
MSVVIYIHPARKNLAQQLGSIMLPADGVDTPTYYGPPIQDIAEGDMVPDKYDLPANPIDQVDASPTPILAVQPAIVPMPVQLVPDDLYPDTQPYDYSQPFDPTQFGPPVYSDYQEISPIKTIGFGFYDANGNPITQDPGPAYLACDEGTVHQWNKDGTQECVPVKDQRFLGPPIQADDPNIVPVDPYYLPANPDNNVDTPSGTIQTLTPPVTTVVPATTSTTTPATTTTTTTTTPTTTTTTTPAAAAAADDDTKLWGIPKTYLWWGGGIALALLVLSESSGGGTTR